MNSRSSFVIIHDAVNEYVKDKRDIPRYVFIDSALYKDLLIEFESQKRYGGITGNSTIKSQKSLIIHTTNCDLIVVPVREKKFMMFAQHEKEYLNHVGDKILLGDGIDEDSYMWR